MRDVLDPRFSMAITYQALEDAGMSFKEFEAELAQADGSYMALSICHKWAEKARKVKA